MQKFFTSIKNKSGPNSKKVFKKLRSVYQKYLALPKPPPGCRFGTCREMAISQNFESKSCQRQRYRDRRHRKCRSQVRRQNSRKVQVEKFSLKKHVLYPIIYTRPPSHVSDSRRKKRSDKNYCGRQKNENLYTRSKINFGKKFNKIMAQRSQD